MVHVAEEDDLLKKIKNIVGDEWATNDQAIRICYHHDLCPHVTFKMPKYVILPKTKEEISELIILLNENKIDFVFRGNGASTHGLVFSHGAVIDLNRMKEIKFDEKNWSVRVGAGVTAFELQSEAKKRGYRVHTAEPAALVCANVMTSGLLSTFSTTYGISADNFINGEFVDKTGKFFDLNDIQAPNVFSFSNKLGDHESFAVCTSLAVKLHPVLHDEAGILVPFKSFEPALRFVKDCALRRIGLAIAILGNEFTSTFISATKQVADELRIVFKEKLEMPYMVLFIGDQYSINSIKQMGYPFMDQELFKTLFLGAGSLKSAKWLDILNELSAESDYSYLKLENFNELSATALRPSAGSLTQDLDPDLKAFFRKKYSEPEMTDLVYLNTFRILSSRYNREHPSVGLVYYIPIEFELISEVENNLKGIAEKYRLKNELGFVTPLDNGKRCVIEYDYFFDHLDESSRARILSATLEAGAALDKFSEREGTIRQVRYVVNQGCARKENLLYA
jgi:hypothetical protein